MHKTKQADSWIKAKATHFMRGRAADTSFAGGESGSHTSGKASFVGRRPYQSLALGLAGFVCGRFLLFDAFTPFGIAYFAAASIVFPDAGLAAGAGVLLGSAVAGGWRPTIEKCLIMVAFSRLLRFPGLINRRRTWAVAFCLFGVAAAVRVIAALIYEPTVDSYVLAVADSFLAFLAMPLFGRVLTVLCETVYRRKLKRNEVVLAVAAVIILAFALINEPFGFVVPFRLLLSLLVIIFAYLGGGPAGAGAGVVGGVLLDLTRGLVPANISLYAFCGCLSGCFRRLGRIGTGLAYTVSFLLLTVYLGEAGIDNALAEPLLAGAVFMIIPERCFEQFRRFLPDTFLAPPAYRQRQVLLQETIAAKLRELGHVFHELSAAFSQVSGSVSRPDQDWTEMLDAITGRVCRTCGMAKTCWERDFYNSHQTIMSLLKTAEEQGCLTEDRIKEDVKRHCIRIPEMIRVANHLTELCRLDNYWRGKIIETREVVSGQLAGIAQIIRALAAEAKMDFDFQAEAEAAVRSEIERLGTEFREIEIISLEKENAEIILSGTACQGEDFCRSVVVPALANLLGQSLTVQKINCNRNVWQAGCRFRICTEQVFRVAIGVSRAGKDGSGVSGDSYSIRRFRDGKLVLMLSDGMGTGDRAAMESNATIALLEGLLSAGFDRDLAVRTVNSILVLRSPEEIFATVDMAVVDQRQGTVEFVKIGAAASYLKSGDTVRAIEASSLPIGILQSIDVSTIRCDLSPGDVIILATDGVTDAGGKRRGGDWLSGFLRDAAVDNPQILAEAIVMRAKNLGQGEIADDMAVIVGKII
ncbi:MAG: stage II sporulation protein E [bacterium]|jgi:stage II sporulation protein E